MSATATRRLPTTPRPAPRLAVRVITVAAVVMLGGTLLVATVARLTGFAAAPPPPPSLASLSLTFADLPDGGVAVRNAATATQIAVIPARDDGFLRMTLRMLYNYRQRVGIGTQSPFTLTEFPGGRMSLSDPTTGQHVELEAFGPSNVHEFANFFTKKAQP
ncbi:MAG: photosynthetic complex assembly protein PuhC [Acidocella sp.]|nr:photosynthetic complex assembly protein PuhC [Acidocella sp.]